MHRGLFSLLNGAYSTKPPLNFIKIKHSIISIVKNIN